MDTNRCVLQGRLTCDPVLRMTQTGRAVDDALTALKREFDN